MSIDWTKAPEGANKAGFTGPDNYLQFYRIPGRFGDYDYWSEKRGWCGNNFPTCADHLFERPAKVEWGGQGLPPVGTVCIVEPHNTMWGFSSTSGYERKILAYYGEYVWLGHAETPLETTRIDKVDFRPIRTPEQIAAEERAKAIEEMCFAEQTLTVKQAKALYEAGYRRQEEGK
ncbi:TPA: hypothetical protein ACGJ1X_003918 [Pseudomonas aeruginosa]|uniref:hypothetical protein n=1 Tax=Pseudomonas aeruginosa TaxID=287 RepID=UPI0006909AF6|nr:hypothetical protein [Pseudomonas aeruginosa]